MAARWVFLKVNGDVEVAVPQSDIHRILHRGDGDYHLFAPSAVALHRLLGQPGDSALPGLVVVLKDGASWYAGDADLMGAHEAVTYLAVPGDLLKAARPWCRGILWGDQRRAYVLDAASLGSGL